MSIPWGSQPKTWRDKLYDLAMGFSEIVAGSLENDQASSRQEAIRTRLDKALRIESEIDIWQSSWVNEKHPRLRTRCDCQCPAALSCICSMPASEFPDNEFALLQVECWALQLLISTALSKLLATEADYTTSWVSHIPLRSSQIASCLETALTLPAFTQTADRSSGVTEGFCRTIFPVWALRDHRSFMNSNERLALESQVYEI
jgi:hypothetical protein